MARSISSSLRNRFRQAFSKPTYGLPPQQLDATRPHFGDGMLGRDGNGGFDDYCTDSLTEERRASLYSSPWHEHVDEDALQRLSTIIPVNTSNGSLVASSKSRVTSWTNTTASGSIHETPVQRKRLSVIQEHGGPHQPSSSAGIHLGGVSVPRKPLPGQKGVGSDAQRLYSALVRRMDQESADKGDKPPEGLQGHTDDGRDLLYTDDLPTVRIVNDSTKDGTINNDFESSSEDHFGYAQQNVRQNLANTFLKKVDSEESVYSRTTNGGVDLSHGYANRTSRLNTSADNVHLQYETDGSNHWMDKHNPYGSEVWEDVQPSTDNFRLLQVGENLTESQTLHHTIGGPNAVQIHHGSAQGHTLEKHDGDSSQSDNLFCGNGAQNVSHVRENAQILTDQYVSQPDEVLDESVRQCRDQAEHLSGTHGTARTRTPSPSVRMPAQLSVAKRRYPLLSVKQVKKETPVPNRHSSLPRSQNGLLQENDLNTQNQVNDDRELDLQNKISASFRRISPANVINVIKSKKSLAKVSSKPSRDENRPSSSSNKTPDGEKRHAVSTPGPAYLAMRSGNSGPRLGNKEKKESESSPTDLLKATLSARLSRPFDMDTPGINRPFDSMYLGKREIGFYDTSGGRLSVANKLHHGDDKQQSSEHGLGGYGGLGPPPFEILSRSEEHTALPHFPTPEEKRSKSGSKSGLSLGSRRMVSNFLRSRRKVDPSGNDTPSISHEEHVRASTQEEKKTGSPLFI